MSTRLNIEGKHYGNLTVVSFAGVNNRQQCIWLCYCICGKQIIVRGANLQNSNTQSCGCLQKKRVSNNLIGQSFGRLQVLAPTSQRQHGNIKWKCLCNCGNIVCVSGASLLSGLTKSCSCLQKDIARQQVGVIGLGISKSGTLFLDTMANLLGKTIEREYYLGGYYYDGKIGRILIEIDSDYWHKNTQDKDCDKDVVALQNGFAILRVTVNRERQAVRLAQFYKEGFEKALSL